MNCVCACNIEKEWRGDEATHTLGKFYMRSEVIRKSSPDYCVGKSVLHGEILLKSSHII